MDTDPIRVCELIVGLPDVNVLGGDDLDAGRPLRLHIESRGLRPVCGECGALAEVKDRPVVELVDLAAFGRRCERCGASIRGAVPTSSVLWVRGPVSTLVSLLRGWGRQMGRAGG